MPQRTPSCQLGIPSPGDSRLISPQSGGTQCPQPTPDTHTATLETEHLIEYSAGRATLVRGAAQEVACTASRRSGPRRWLRAVSWLIAAGLHGRANATTQTVAEDLAGRMDYDTGHVRYCLDQMVARTGISHSSIKRHVGYLRELGALAWVQHGTRANVRRALGLGGYAATATVYAAVIPPVYDHAMGHTIIGTGYGARIVVDLRKQARPVDNSPVDNSDPAPLGPPSLTLDKEESQVQMVGGFNDTPRKSAVRQQTVIPHQKTSSNSQAGRRTASQVARDIQTTRLVRALVNWTQKIPLRRLEFVLRPLTDRGLDAFQIADELTGLCSGMRWKPRRPDQFILARLAADTIRQQELDAAVPAMSNQAWSEWIALSQLAATPEPERTDDDRRRARMDWSIWPEVIAHFDEDELDAIDLYGKRLVDFAIGQSAREQEAYARV